MIKLLRKENLATLPTAPLRCLHTDRRDRKPRPRLFCILIFCVFSTCHDKLHIHLLRVQISNVDVVVVVVVIIVVVVPVVVVAVGVVDNVHGGIDDGQDKPNKPNGGELRGEHEKLQAWILNQVTRVVKRWTGLDLWDIFKAPTMSFSDCLQIT